MNQNSEKQTNATVTQNVSEQNVTNQNLNSNNVNILKTPTVNQTQNTANVQSSETVKQDNSNNNDNNNNEQNGKPSKFKTFLAILLFIFFFALVYFLPEITNFINEKKGEMNKVEITTGTLVCSQKKNTKTLDIDLNATFKFVNSEIISLTYTQTTTGDKNDDKDELEKLRNECSELKNHVTGVEGISVICSLNNGINTTKQIIDYEKVDNKNIGTAYIEAGGIYPEFKKGQSINSVESKMTSSSYKCERYSS